MMTYDDIETDKFSSCVAKTSFLGKLLVKLWLVLLTIWRHMKVNRKDYIPYITENKQCLKPPIRLVIYI